MDSQNSVRDGSPSCEEKLIKPRVHLEWLVSNRLGEFGRYQRHTYVLLGLPAIMCAMHALSWVFLGASMNYRCLLPGEHVGNASYYDLPPGNAFNTSFPLDKNGKPSQCERYEDGDTESVATCTDYVFDTSQYKSSARSDFRMVCSATYWGTVAETLFKLGIIVGAILFGRLSDRLGRRPVFFFALCSQLTFGASAAIAPNYTLFVLARFLAGVAYSGVFLVAFVIALELVGKSKRVIAAMGLQYFFTFGWVLTGVLAYYIREWRYLQLALSLPGIVFLSYYWFLPESVRWLLTQNKKAEALTILRKAALVNKVQIPDSELENLTTESVPKSTPLRNVLRYPRTTIRSLNIFSCWFVNSGVYYGLALNSSNLGGNDYINFILSGAVEVPAYIILLLTLNTFGRKKVLCSTMILSGVFLIACGFIPKSQTTFLVTMNMLGKLFNAAAYADIYMYAAELFPTVIRSSFMGICAVSARMGAILSDYVILLQLFWKPLPHLIFGFVSLASGLLSLLLPETLNKRLPDTLEESEQFGTAEYDEKDAHVSPLKRNNSNKHEEAESNF